MPIFPRRLRRRIAAGIMDLSPGLDRLTPVLLGLAIPHPLVPPTNDVEGLTQSWPFGREPTSEISRGLRRLASISLA